MNTTATLQQRPTISNYLLRLKQKPLRMCRPRHRRRSNCSIYSIKWALWIRRQSLLLLSGCHKSPCSKTSWQSHSPTSLNRIKSLTTFWCPLRCSRTQRSIECQSLPKGLRQRSSRSISRNSLATEWLRTSWANWRQIWPAWLPCQRCQTSSHSLFPRLHSSHFSNSISRAESVSTLSSKTWSRPPTANTSTSKSLGRWRKRKRVASQQWSRRPSPGFCRCRGRCTGESSWI